MNLFHFAGNLPWVVIAGSVADLKPSGKQRSV
jgi:hypothetical protein